MLLKYSPMSKIKKIRAKYNNLNSYGNMKSSYTNVLKYKYHINIVKKNLKLDY